MPLRAPYYGTAPGGGWVFLCSQQRAGCACAWWGEGLVSELTGQSRPPEPEGRPRARTTAIFARQQECHCRMGRKPGASHRMAWHWHGRSKSITGKCQVQRVEQLRRPRSRPAPTSSPIPQSMESSACTSGMWRPSRTGRGRDPESCHDRISDGQPERGPKFEHALLAQPWSHATRNYWC